MKLLSSPEVWTLKAWDEVDPSEHGPDSNTWSPIPVWDAEVRGTGGVTVKTEMDAKEIAFCKAVNLPGSPSYWQWADQPEGTIYWGKDWRTDTVTWWAHCLQASSSRLRFYNRVVIDAKSDDEERIRVVGIPKSADYSPYLHDMNFLQRCFLQSGYNAIGNEEPLMPVWSGGFFVRNGLDKIWFRRAWLRDFVEFLGCPTAPDAGEVTVSFQGTDWLGRQKNLNIRPAATMFNTGVGYLYPGTVTSLQEVFVNAEGVWGKLNSRLYIALFLNSTGKYYTSWRP